MIELDQEMEAKAAEEWYDYESPVNDVRRVHIQTHQEPRCREDEGEFWESVGGHYALVPQDEWEQALDLQAAYDDRIDDLDDLSAEFNELKEDYGQLCEELYTRETRGGTDCYARDEELEELSDENDREWKRYCELVMRVIAATGIEVPIGGMTAIEAVDRLRSERDAAVEKVHDLETDLDEAARLARDRETVRGGGLPTWEYESTTLPSYGSTTAQYRENE